MHMRPEDGTRHKILRVRQDGAADNCVELGAMLGTHGVPQKHSWPTSGQHWNMKAHNNWVAESSSVFSVRC